MTTTTTLEKALRSVNQFILDAVRKDHRATNEELAVEPTDYGRVFDSVFETRSRNFQVRIREAQTQGEDSILMCYTANNHRYSLKIEKLVAAQAA